MEIKQKIAHIGQRISRDGLTSIPSWAMKWIYWNGHLYKYEKRLLDIWTGRKAVFDRVRYQPQEPRQQNSIPPSDEEYNAQTLETMRRVLNKDSNCVDVGCFEASILREMVRLAPKGTHFAFEPIPEFYQALLDAFRSYANVRIFEYALNDSVGITSFQHVLSNPSYSGLQPRKYVRANETIQEINVRTELLDNIVPNDLPIHFMKIDVEGAELQVLQGAKETLKRNRPTIVFEHGPGAADFYGTTPEDLYDLLAWDCGLNISLMQRWLTGEKPFNRNEFAEQFFRGLNYYYIAYP